MAGSQEENPFVLTALAEVQSTGTLEVRSGSESDLKTESGSERATYVGGGINGEEKPRADRPGEDGLPRGDLDIGELSFGEDLLAAGSRDLGVRERERERET